MKLLPGKTLHQHPPLLATHSHEYIRRSFLLYGDKVYTDWWLRYQQILFGISEVRIEYPNRTAYIWYLGPMQENK